MLATLPSLVRSAAHRCHASSARSSLERGELASRIQRQASDVDEFTRHLSDFRPGEEDLLRGSSLTTVLSYQGRIFATSEGSSETYALSKRVSKIDAFISHNWSVPRRHKFLALSMHFNLPRATFASVVVVMGLAVLTAMEMLPTMINLQSSSSTYCWGICCRILCIPVFISVALVRLHCDRCCDDTIVFLDKTCIEQVDLDLKTKGIQKLGAFLQRSSCMVIIYTDVYLQRLWTVYELASFLALHSVSRIEFIPAFLPYLFFTPIICFYLMSIILLLLEIFFNSEYLRDLPDFELRSVLTYSQDLAIIVLVFFLSLVFRAWSRSKAELEHRLTTFSVHECMCACEDDRSKVYHNIAVLMRGAGIVRREAEDEEALIAFNVFARNGMSEAVDAAVGAIGLRPKHILSITACGFGPHFIDEIAGGLACGMPFRLICSTSLVWIGLTTGGVPCILAVSAKFASCCLELKAWREWTFVGIVVIIATVFLELYMFGLRTMQVWGNQSVNGMLALAASSTLPLAIYLAVFRYRKVMRCCRSWLGPLPSQRGVSTIRGEIVGAATSSEVVSV